MIDGQPRYSTESHVGDFPVIMPAGRCYLDRRGRRLDRLARRVGVLKVGPRSAGADPGPACYGLGGEEPTVTDAYRRVSASSTRSDFLGGRLRHAPGPRRGRGSPARGRGSASTRSKPPRAMLRVATSPTCTRLSCRCWRGKGIDPRRFCPAWPSAGRVRRTASCSPGGRYAARASCRCHPGTLCAQGALAADVAGDFVQTIPLAAAASAGQPIDGHARCAGALPRGRRLARRAEDCNPGAARRLVRGHPLSSASPSRSSRRDRAASGSRMRAAAGLRARFHDRHERLYGYADARGDGGDARCACDGRGRDTKARRSPA